MDLYNMMWNDLATIKKEEYYLRRYINTQQNIKLILKIFTLVAAAVGIAAAKGYIPISNVAIFVIILIVQLLQSIMPNIIASDESIDHFKNIKARIGKLYTEYEELFYMFHNYKITEEECLKKRKKLLNVKLNIDSDSYKKSLFIYPWHLKKAESEAYNTLKLY